MQILSNPPHFRPTHMELACNIVGQQTDKTDRRTEGQDQSDLRKNVAEAEENLKEKGEN